MKKVWKKWTALLMAVCLAALMMVPTMAAMDDTTTEDVKNGIFQVWVEYDGEKLEGGTCFLINDQYVLTSLHVVDLAANLEDYAEALGFEIDEDDLEIVVYTYRDQHVTASLTSVQSEDADYALLKLNETVATKNALTLGDSDTVSSGNTVYAFGYPATSLSATADNTTADVSVTSGIVSKFSTVSNISYIEHEAKLTSGNSGGPLTNEAGEVIGINCFLTDAGDYGVEGADNYYAVKINEVRDGLDVAGISYTSSDGSSTADSSDETTTDTTADTTTDTTAEAAEEETVDKTELNTLITKAEGKTESDYTSASWTTLSTALTAAKEVADSDSATQDEVDSAAETLEKAIEGLEESSGLPFGLSMPVLIGIIVVIAVVIILLIVFLVIKPGKKKKKDDDRTYYDDPYANGGYGNGPIDPGRTQQNVGGGYGGYGYGDGSEGTTILDSGDNPTTLLGGGAAYLIRKKNGEKITINTPSFALGKERKRVNYCISDNSSVSRYHAVISKKGADYYIADQQSSNFTYVNGVQVSPFAETLLTDRTVIKLSDEEFEFHLS